MEKIVFFGKCFYEKKLCQCYEWEYGVPKTEKKVSFLCRIFFSQKTFLFKKNVWKICIKGSMGHKKMMRVIETCISKTKSMERFFDAKVFLKDIVVSGSTENPPLKKNLYFGGIIFFTDICFPQTKLIHLASFINGVHKIDAINKNRSLEKPFSRKMFFSLNRFEWHSFKLGLPKIDDRREKMYFWELFHRKSIHRIFFDWYAMNYQWGYTRMMMEIKTMFKTYNFLRKCFFIKCYD